VTTETGSTEVIWTLLAHLGLVAVFKKVASARYPGVSFGFSLSMHSEANAQSWSM
jgi:hypothetical protein